MEKMREYRNLIHKVAGKFQTGLHPSFTAGGDGILVNTETDRLTHILERRSA